MIFRSQLRRQTRINWLLIWIPDLIIAATASSVMDGGLIGFGIAFAALLTLSIVYWILRSIVMWAAYLAFGRRFVQQYLYDYLVTNRYPMPNEYETSPQEYFTSVMENRELDPELRVKAAVEVGTFAAYSGAFDMQRLSKLTLASESAIAEYRRRFAQPTA